MAVVALGDILAIGQCNVNWIQKSNNAEIGQYNVNWIQESNNGAKETTVKTTWNNSTHIQVIQLCREISKLPGINHTGSITQNYLQ